MPNTIAFPRQTDIVDPTDVATVTARELAFALKILSASGGTLAEAHLLSEADIQAVEHHYWHTTGRTSARKTNVLLRFRALIDVVRARRVNALIVDGNADTLLGLLAAAASQRLNTTWGFNPHKIVRTAAALHRPAAAVSQPFAIAA